MRGRTSSRTSGPTGFARRLRLRSDAMVASFSTGTSAKESTEVSAHPGVGCQGIQSSRGGKSLSKMGSLEQTLLPPVSMLLSNQKLHQIILSYMTIQMSWQGANTMILNVDTALQFSQY